MPHWAEWRRSPKLSFHSLPVAPLSTNRPTRMDLSSFMPGIGVSNSEIADEATRAPQRHGGVCAAYIFLGTQAAALETANRADATNIEVLVKRHFAATIGMCVARFQHSRPMFSNCFAEYKKYWFFPVSLKYWVVDPGTSTSVPKVRNVPRVGYEAESRVSRDQLTPAV